MTGSQPTTQPGTPALVLGTTNVQGNSGTYLDANSTIQVFDATNPANVTDNSPAPGVVAKTARRDHVHGLAANAVTQSGLSDGSGSINVTSATFVNTDLVVTFTTTGGDLIVSGTLSGSSDTVASDNVIAFTLDGAATQGSVDALGVLANYVFNLGTVTKYTGVAAGSHTVRMVWHNSAGQTWTSASGARHMTVVELKH